MAKVIDIPQKGQPNWNNAEVARQVAAVINALAGMTVEPRSLGQFKSDSNGYVLDLSMIRDFIDERISVAVAQVIENDIGVRAECNDDGTLTVELYSNK